MESFKYSGMAQAAKTGRISSSLYRTTVKRCCMGCSFLKLSPWAASRTAIRQYTDQCSACKLCQGASHKSIACIPCTSAVLPCQLAGAQVTAANTLLDYHAGFTARAAMCCEGLHCPLPEMQQVSKQAVHSKYEVCTTPASSNAALLKRRASV